MKICPQCKNQVKEEWVTCRYCEEKLINPKIKKGKSVEINGILVLGPCAVVAKIVDLSVCMEGSNCPMKPRSLLESNGIIAVVCPYYIFMEDSVTKWRPWPTLGH